MKKSERGMAGRQTARTANSLLSMLDAGQKPRFFTISRRAKCGGVCYNKPMREVRRRLLQ